MTPSKARITAIGAYVPERILSNADLERMVDTSDEWIVSRTGIKERRIAAADEFASDLAVKAVRNLTERYDKPLDEVELILVCTITPDFHTPGVASLVQAKLGLSRTGVMDLNAACAGFTSGLHVANGLITAGLHKKVLVIGTETLSKITDYTDRTTCVLFGDGAGAVLVERDEREPGFIAHEEGSDGEAGRHLYCTGLSAQWNGEALSNTGKIVQNGREVYRWAVTRVPAGMKRLAAKGGLSLDEIDWFVPHSANLRMIESICEKSGFPLERTLHSLVHYGNTSSATIPLALDLAVHEGKLKRGDTVLLYGFGGGLAWSGQLVVGGV